MSFNSDDFTTRLIAETLFYDEEFDALGNLSLVHTSSNRELYVASYVPEDGLFVVEEATDWEEYIPGSPDDIGYALAVDSREFGTYETAEDAAAEVLTLAKAKGLEPSITLLFEEDDA